MQRTIGGDRVGSGKQMKVSLKSYERSTHDLSYIWRSTMASGTLVPFINELGLPGDTFDIDLDCVVKTHPTVGPLFGSFKTQLDVYICPIRLYQGQLHNNKIGIGMDMAKVKLPQIRMKATNPIPTLETIKDLDNFQINSSSLYSYLNIRGLGKNSGLAPVGDVIRDFNALSVISYWDIYKNYYANKQEEIGVFVHNNNAVPENVTGVGIYNPAANGLGFGIGIMKSLQISTGNTILFDSGGVVNPNNVILHINNLDGQIIATRASDLLGYVWTNGAGGLTGTYAGITYWLNVNGWGYNANGNVIVEPKLQTFALSNIDLMREALQTHLTGTPYIIDENTLAPYGYSLKKYGVNWAKTNSQEGLGIKTYQSDLFNNWMKTEWLLGANGINEITAIDTSSGSFTVDTLNLSKKVYDMLNRIAISGGTYDDWLDTVYTHERMQRIETPMYMGGLSKELVFTEVFSTAESNNGQPLGTLAGKGRMSEKHKGGKVRISVDEPSYIIGIVSLTPRLDYSQGNKWDVNLKTMDDFHKPALDEIGFQALITDQMAWFDTVSNGVGLEIFKSAGQQPAWINYMTNVNQVRGNFAVKDNEMFMTLNRRFEPNLTMAGAIKDLTTYIDPVKFNYIFAETSRDAQNFWTQISVDMNVRRKMSAKIMPNL